MTGPAPLPEDVTSTAFRTALGAFASGVTVVTTCVGSEAYGMTVSAFSSLSLDPPLVLVCLAEGGRGQELVTRSGRFCVNVLAASQGPVARLFADRDRPRGAGAFDGVPHRPGATGCPVLLGTVAHVDCTVSQQYRAGDHTIVVGTVVTAAAEPHAAPLLVHRREFRSLGPIPEASPAGLALVRSADRS